MLLACSSGSTPSTTTATPPTGTTMQPTSTSPSPRTTRQWRVFDGDLAILEIRDEPGPLLSTALPPPGAAPPTHPFLSATALDAAHESKLRQLLDASSNVDEFLRALTGAGYRVVAI